MTDEHPPIPVKGLTRSTAYAEIQLHMTGGLRARQVEGGWQVGPLPNSNGIGWLGVIPQNALGRFVSEIAQEVFGAEERPVDFDVPARMWRRLPDKNAVPFQAADRWGFVATHAQRSGDGEYARIAASIATSLRAAGVQLRNLSDCYYDQLLGALKRKDQAGSRFANIALTELHIACHALTAELGSARDYLSMVAAQRVSAPDRIDALNRLVDWATKSANASAAEDPLVAQMVAGFDKNGGDPWLWEIGEFRNTFLHRLPLGLTDSAKLLTLREIATRNGPVQSITLEIEAPIGSGKFADALGLFAKLSARLDDLAHFAVPLARYPAKPPVFTAI